MISFDKEAVADGIAWAILLLVGAFLVFVFLILAFKFCFWLIEVL